MPEREPHEAAYFQEQLPLGRTLDRPPPAAARLITTWEDSYERAVWTTFPQSCGYRQTDNAVFEKLVK